MAFTKTLTQNSPTVVKMGVNSTTPTGGTDDLLTSGNPVKFQPNVSFINIRQHSNSFTKRVGIPARRFWDIGLQFYMQGSGGAGTIAINGYAAIDALLRSTGMAVASSGGTITYTPATPTVAGTAKCEVWVENDGLLHKAQNSQGNIVFEGVSAYRLVIVLFGAAVSAMYSQTLRKASFGVPQILLTISGV